MKIKFLLFLLLSLAVNIAQAQTRTQSRSAKTGRYVTDGYAKKHKATTYTTKTKNTSSKRRRKP
ncbi:MAG: hypothetical protein KA536_06490 [Saprospiraceae bacterium]|nr:hypothetical protein [Saprospiraceae bacterium]